MEKDYKKKQNTIYSLPPTSTKALIKICSTTWVNKDETHYWAVIILGDIKVSSKGKPRAELVVGRL